MRISYLIKFISFFRGKRLSKYIIGKNEFYYLKRGVIVFFLVGILSLSFSSCYPTRNVPSDKYLLLKNSYKIKNGNVKKHSIPSYYSQKANRKIFFFRFYLNVYDWGTAFRKGSWFNRQMTENIGEPPVIYDSNLVDLTGKNIKKHMNNLGYYNSSVSAKIKTWDMLNISTVQYIIDAGNPYTIRNISYEIPEADLRRFVQADLGNSLIKSGMNFSVESLEKERDRIVEALNNAGYYYFMRNQITYNADTNLNTNQVDLKLKIFPLKAKGTTEDSLGYIADKRYIIRDVYVLYNLLRSDLSKSGADTLIVSITERGDQIYKYHFIHNGPMAINPKAIINALFIKATRAYKKRDIVESYKAISALNTFRYINIELEDISNPIDQKGELLCYVSLMIDKKFSFSSNSELKHTGGDFGLQQNIGLRSRNTFRNAEILSLDLRGAMEMQSSTNVASTSKWPFNVYEAGINTAIDFPRFIVPFRIFKANRYRRPKTRVTLGYNYQKRPDYTRYILNGSFGYTSQPRPRYYNNFRLLEVSSVKIYPSEKFHQIIDKYTDPRIKYSYQDHLVLSTSYSFTYNEHRYKGSKPFSFFFGAVDWGGGLWNLFPIALGLDNHDSIGQLLLFDIPSASYFKIEADGRYYVPTGKNLMNVFRTFIGVGIPYGNSKALPFEKSFYIGGANSLRAWTIGTLGPGAYNSNATTFEMTGDIKIEMNYELRFLISGSLEGAFFADAGNIWQINKSDAQPGGNFQFKSFIPQMAADFGYGLRYDLEFLIIRVDIAHPIYQPYLPIGSRWSAMSLNGNLLAGFNFAIGYPF